MFFVKMYLFKFDIVANDWAVQIMQIIILFYVTKCI